MVPQTTRRIAKNFFSLLSAKVIGRIIGFLTVVFVARRLGDVAFGQLSFAQVFVSYSVLVANFGFTTCAIREIARERERTHEYTGDVIFLRATLSLLSFGVLIAIAHVAGLSPTKRLLIFYYGLALFPECLDLTWVYIAHERMEFQAVINIFRTGAYAALVFLVLPRFPLPVKVAQINLLAVTLTAALCITMYFHHFETLRLNRNCEFWISFVKNSLPIGVTLMMFAICYQFDTLMISFMKGSAMVGWYSAAYKIIMLLITVGSLFGMALLPALSSRIKISLDSARSVMAGSSRFMTLSAMPLAIGGTVLSGRIVVALFGRGYANAAVPFAILCWSVAIIYLTVVFTNTLLALGRQKQLMLYVTSAAVANIILNFLAIPRFGLSGAAVTTCISEAIILMGAYAAVHRVIQIPFSIYLLKAGLASFAMGIVLVFMKDLNIFLSVTSGIGVYLMCLYVIKGISWKDLRLIREITGLRQE